MNLRIKEVLKEKKTTVVSLANSVGMAQPSMSNIVNGKSTPSLETLHKIATALNVEVWELFTASTSGEINGFIEYRGTIYKIQSKDDLKRFYDIVNN